MKGNKCIERRKRQRELELDEPNGVQRTAANARERARMRVLSHAYSRLKTSLPWVPPDTKLSKLDTLRLAATYIAHLRKVLTDDGAVHPQVTFTWPFTISNVRPCSGEELSPPPPSSPEQPATPFPSFPPPCEYMAIAYPEQPRTTLGHFLR